MYKLDIKYYKVSFENIDKDIILSKLKKNFRLYFNSAENNYLNELLIKYTNDLKVDFKNKKEVINFLNNFSSYYNLGNFEINLYSISWSYKKIIVSKNYKNQGNNKWVTYIDINLIEHWLIENKISFDLDLNEIYNITNELIDYISFGLTRIEAAKELNKTFQKDFNKLKLSNYVDINYLTN